MPLCSLKDICTMTLNRTPNIADPDGFYQELIESQRDLSDEQADMLTTKLVLILANHVGDRALLTEAITLARANTLAKAGAAA